jgi:hypothetical protein
MGACFRWLWDQSTEGNILCQFVFALTILPGLASYTIQLWTILNQIVFLLAFSGVFFWWSLLKGVKKDQMSTRNGPVSSGSDTLAKDIA